MPAPIFTQNETITMQHQAAARALSALADQFEAHTYTKEQAINLLRDIADELNAQAFVVSLRDAPQT